MSSNAAPGRRHSTAHVGDVEIPPAVAAVAGRVPLRCVWRNELGGLTFELPSASRFLKWAPAASDLPLLDEAMRLRWASPYTPVPEVVDAGIAADGSTWLLTERLSGTSAVSDRWKAAPRTAVRAIGEALQAFHEALPVESARSPGRPKNASPVPRHGPLPAPSTLWSGISLTAHLSVDDAIDTVSEPPSVDRLVVCHADSCSPNTLVNDDGSWSGHVDLGRMGVGDRWADIAIATWSTTWNYGPGWEGELLAAYGLDADPDRTRYYRLLWDLTD